MSSKIKAEFIESSEKEMINEAKRKTGKVIFGACWTKSTLWLIILYFLFQKSALFDQEPSVLTEKRIRKTPQALVDYVTTTHRQTETAKRAAAAAALLTSTASNGKKRGRPRIAKTTSKPIEEMKIINKVMEQSKLDDTNNSSTNNSVIYKNFNGKNFTFKNCTFTNWMKLFW